MVTERGFVGSTSHFRALVAGLRPRPPAEAYLRLRMLPGEQAQADWAHLGHLQIGRARRPLMPCRPRWPGGPTFRQAQTALRAV